MNCSEGRLDGGELILFDEREIASKTELYGVNEPLQDSVIIGLRGCSEALKRGGFLEKHRPVSQVRFE